MQPSLQGAFPNVALTDPVIDFGERTMQPQGAFPNVALTDPVIDFGERTMHIDCSCGFKCDAEGTAQQHADIVGCVNEM